MKLSKIVLGLVFALTATVAGCADPMAVKPEAQVVTVNKYIPCSVPASYFETHKYPVRDWDWSGKKESDVVQFILDHRDVINQQNQQLEKAQAVLSNCKAEADKASANDNTNGH